MSHNTEASQTDKQGGLILGFAGVLTASPVDVHRAWCVSEGLAQHSQRSP
ncbi:hypothetical protein ACWCQF_14870 [Streptomyces rubiginosohelvolus]